jgi:hypothetical protein
MWGAKPPCRVLIAPATARIDAVRDPDYDFQVFLEKAAVG